MVLHVGKGDSGSSNRLDVGDRQMSLLCDLYRPEGVAWPFAKFLPVQLGEVTDTGKAGGAGYFRDDAVLTHQDQVTGETQAR